MKKNVSSRQKKANVRLAVNLNAEQLAQQILEEAVQGLGIASDAPPNQRQAAYLTVIEDLIISRIDHGLCANATVGEISEELQRLITELLASYNTDPVQLEPDQVVH